MIEILVTGAAGLLGRHLISSLTERGDTVRALVLPNEDTDWLERQNVAIYRGDVREASTLVEPMRGVDTVFHLAGMMGQWRPMQDYFAVNVTGTENICRTALSSGVRRLVHVSSWTVYGIGLGQPAHESLPIAPFRDPYPITKAEGEKVVSELVDSAGLPAVIIRPDTFFGPGDRLHFGRIADRIAAGRGIIIGSGRNTLPFVYVGDVVQGLLLAADRENAAGRIYNIAHDQPLTQEELIRTIALEIGVKPPRFHVAFRPLYTLASVIEQAAIRARSQRQPPITRLGARLFGTDNRHSIDKARSELGYSPRVPIPEGLRLTASWYRQQRTEAADILQVGKEKYV